MARNVGIQAENNFTRGLITEATALNFPENAVTATNNCRFDRTGVVSRRKGIDVEQPPTFTEASGTLGVVREYQWRGVGKDGDKNFLVLQIGSALSFYEPDVAGDYSGNAKAFSVALGSYKTPEAIADTLTEEPCSFTTGNGYLFVAHPSIDPIFIEYDEDTDTITVGVITLQIRDTSGLEEDGVAIDLRPSSLTNDHHYNLLNQGWAHTDEDHFEEEGIAFDLWEKEPGAPPWPSNADIPWYWRNSKDQFDGRIVDRGQLGNSPAPRGYYILDAFSLDRAGESSVAIDTVTTEGNRPNTIAFFAGRVWYAGTNYNKFRQNVYYSKIIEDESDFGKCYQINDPTSVNLSDLLDSDGGLIKVLDMGQVYNMEVIGNSLYLFSSQGVWSIGGSGEGTSFVATDFSINKVSDVVCLSGLSFVSVDGTPMWWNLDGIYTFQADQSGLNFSVVSVTRETIDDFFIEDIPSRSRLHSKGEYDRLSKTVQWVFKSTTATTVAEDYEYDRILVLDTVSGAFYPWTVDETVAMISGIFVSTDTSVTASDTNVIDSADAQVQDSTPQNVTVSRNSTTVLDSKFKYILRVDSTPASNLGNTVCDPGFMTENIVHNVTEDHATAGTAAPPARTFHSYDATPNASNSASFTNWDIIDGSLESQLNDGKLFYDPENNRNIMYIRNTNTNQNDAKNHAFSVFDTDTREQTSLGEITDLSLLTEPLNPWFNIQQVGNTNYMVAWVAQRQRSLWTGSTTTDLDIDTGELFDIILIDFVNGTIVDSVSSRAGKAMGDYPYIHENSSTSYTYIFMRHMNTTGSASNWYGEHWDISTSGETISKNTMRTFAVLGPFSGNYQPPFDIFKGPGKALYVIQSTTAAADEPNKIYKFDPAANTYAEWADLTNIYQSTGYYSGTDADLKMSSSQFQYYEESTGILWIMLRDFDAAPNVDRLWGLNSSGSLDTDCGTFTVNPIGGLDSRIWYNYQSGVRIWNKGNVRIGTGKILTNPTDGLAGHFNIIDTGTCTWTENVGCLSDEANFEQYDWTDTNSTAWDVVDFTKGVSYMGKNTCGVTVIEFPMQTQASCPTGNPVTLFGTWFGSSVGGYSFAEEFDTTYHDWASISTDTVGIDYTSFFTTGEKISGNLIMNQQANYVTVFSNVETDSSCIMNGRYDFSNNGNSGEWSTPQETYSTVRPNRAVQRRRLKVRGTGPAISLHFTSTSTKPFNIIGWSGFISSNAAP